MRAAQATDQLIARLQRGYSQALYGAEGRVPSDVRVVWLAWSGGSRSHLQGLVAVGLTLTKRDVAHAVGATLCCGRAPRGCAEAERRRVKPLTMVETEAADADSTRAEEAQGAAVGGAANPCAGRYVADDAAPVDPSVKVPDGGR